MNERALTTKILNKLRKEFPDAWFYKVCDRFTAGIPDIIGCVAGSFISIEVKSEHGKLTHLQVHSLTRIAGAGGISAVCRSMPDLVRFIEFIKKEVKKNVS